MEMSKSAMIKATLLREIENQRSVAPREIAEGLASEGEDWRKLLPHVKAAAIELEAENLLTFLRKGKPVSSKGLKGVYRLAQKLAQKPA